MSDTCCSAPEGCAEARQARCSTSTAPWLQPTGTIAGRVELGVYFQAWRQYYTDKAPGSCSALYSLARNEAQGNPRFDLIRPSARLEPGRL